MILPWKKNDGDKKAVFIASPEKARLFLERAEKAIAQSGFEVGLFYFANALKFDPASISTLDAMWN
ncbi:MAG: hypothetical protein FJ285_08150, partial [Planctomycetes bacterium]|nr:hypothetical protein [Planctomycetota bacterium]